MITSRSARWGDFAEHSRSCALNSSSHTRADLCSANPSSSSNVRSFVSARPSLRRTCSLPSFVFVADQDFVSKVTLAEAQLGEASPLDPSLHHLLRDAKVDSATILAPSRCQITGRKTFAALDDTVEGLKTLAVGIGIDLSEGGMRHKRDFARITKAWKKAKTQANINTREALQKHHGEHIEILPENWTSGTFQFRKKYGNDLRDEELPSQ